ncbi:transposase [Microcystis aeruginosa NIES-843]|uniref:Transposase n=1 Tax=Microcystis aeruginosa (strain NIES-843 / IAM M-2473) TaxID=449447 RepID=B0JGP4_MICAN|nr:transposase [Microcystis aeruginosa NIES-843]
MIIKNYGERLAKKRQRIFSKSGIAPLGGLVILLPRCPSRVLPQSQRLGNYCENYTTNGLTEGMNTKIKPIKKISYGCSNLEHLRLKLFAGFNS